MSRWWGIRHFRWYWYSRWLNFHLSIWAEMGGFPIPAQSDLDYLDAVWKGQK